MLDYGGAIKLLILLSFVTLVTIPFLYVIGLCKVNYIRKMNSIQRITILALLFLAIAMIGQFMLSQYLLRKGILISLLGLFIYALPALILIYKKK